MRIDVLLEHPDFFAVHKPPEIAVQDEQDKTGILPLLCQQLNVDKLWLVHRLDKVTSGILIVARTAQAAAKFGELFTQKHIQKFYLAVSHKKPKKKQGAVKGGMQKVRGGAWMLNSSNDNFAHSQFFSFGVSPNTRLFLVKPLTGKTHQIRVALKSVGSPILGDTLYKGQQADRTYLHAFALRFVYDNQAIDIRCMPTTGQAFLESDMQESIAALADVNAYPWPKTRSPKIRDSKANTLQEGKNERT